MRSLGGSNAERRGFAQRLQTSKLARVLSYRDFRLLWIGAFVSFTGSWIQKVAQGYFVYQLTGDETKLALVSFASSIPVFVFGFVAGSLSDTFNKRLVLVITQALFGISSLYLAAATYFGFVQYWHILAVSLLLGFVGCVEMPTRQSVVSRVVPQEDLATAVPINAMTFNVARIFGPAIGALMLTSFGVGFCYLVDGLSYLALIWSAYAIRSDLSATRREPQPVKDLIFEGALYTWREPRLRTLLILESITAMVGIFFLPLVPAYVEQVLGFGPTVAKAANGSAYTAIGIGALVGLFINVHRSESRHKGAVIRYGMLTIGVSLFMLGVLRQPFYAYIAMAFVGAATLIQFNTTNSLFQTLAPERLRGRVLSMHIWALNGLSPFGVLFFGWLAEATRNNPDVMIAGHHYTLPSTGVALACDVGAVLMLVGTLAAFFSRRTLADLK